MSKKRPVLLACGGDVCLAGCVSEGIRRHGPGWVFEKLAPRLASADLMTFNWESPVLPARRKPPEKGLVVPERLVRGVTAALPRLAVSLANNHLFDAGDGGVAATQRRLDLLGIEHFGAGETEREAAALGVVEVNGARIGFLARAEDCPQLRRGRFPGPALIRYPGLVREVGSAARECDWLVVHLHHGVEFVDWPAPHFLRLCRELVAAGADLVLGGHPHVPQGHEACGRGHIFYCLGNLVFEVGRRGYQDRGSPWTRRSAVALVPLGPDAVGEPTFVPYRLYRDGRPAPLGSRTARPVLDHLAAVSADLADPDAMQRHWRDTALRYLGIYLDWAAGTIDERGHATEETVRFFDRLAMNESRMFVRELFGDAAWPRKIGLLPWTDA
jgi:poly-gamma-glutamate synthesis protein (capsule biosynthesis protein)